MQNQFMRESALRACTPPHQQHGRKQRRAQLPLRAGWVHPGACIQMQPDRRQNVCSQHWPVLSWAPYAKLIEQPRQQCGDSGGRTSAAATLRRACTAVKSRTYAACQQRGGSTCPGSAQQRPDGKPPPPRAERRGSRQAARGARCAWGAAAMCGGGGCHVCSGRCGRATLGITLPTLVAARADVVRQAEQRGDARGGVARQLRLGRRDELAGDLPLATAITLRCSSRSPC